MFKLKIPLKKNNSEQIKFFKDKGLLNIINEGFDIKSNVYPPNLNDLYRLYNFVYLNKRTTILEFGSGWSSLIFFKVFLDLKKKYLSELDSLRRANKFEIFTIENEKKYLNISKRRIKKFTKLINKKYLPKINFFFSDVNMTLFNQHIATEYKFLPMCVPDFIYLDGPDQFKVKDEINGISTRHPDMKPMACDIIKIEFFLEPGAIIVCDGRSANARFLKSYLRRQWKYIDDTQNDQRIFLLNEKPLGKYNKKLINFYNRK